MVVNINCQLDTLEAELRSGYVSQGGKIHPDCGWNHSPSRGHYCKKEGELGTNMLASAHCSLFLMHMMDAYYYLLQVLVIMINRNLELLAQSILSPLS